MTLKEQIAVMQAFDAGKEVQVSDSIHGWLDSTNPTFNWNTYTYRIKPNKFKEMVDDLDKHDIATTHITFGGVANYNTGDLKVVYDTHIRTVLFDMLDVGKMVKFKLVPLNAFGEEVLEEINISRHAKQ